MQAAVELRSPLAVILPTYEEAGHIAELLESIERQLAHAGNVSELEIVVVDDSPTPSTGEAVQAYIARSDSRCIRYLHRQQSRGLADAVRFGIEQARCERFIVMDTDFNHHPRYLPMLADLLQYFDLVVGSRYIVGGGMLTSRFRYFGSFAFNSLVRFFLRTRVHDNLSGFFGMRRELYRQLFHDAVFYGYGDYFVRLIHNARRLRARLVEVPVVYELRPTGASKTQFWRHLFTYAYCVVKTAVVFPRLRK